MIVVKVWGGLGNQLFQYAFGYMMAKEHLDEVVFDTSFYQKHQYKYVGRRSYELDKLSCSVKIAHKLPGMISFLESFAINRVLRRKKGTIELSLGKLFFVKEARRKYMPEVPYKADKINYYDGYWQSGQYFEKYRDELYELLQPQVDIPTNVREFMAIIQEKENSVSVHVRKGDFHGRIGHEVGIEYYKKAIQCVNDMISDPYFFVFSDDINWAKENIDFGPNVAFAEFRCAHGAICDLLTMSKCKHGIMSASTFSWWGNWRKDGIVIAPIGEYFNNRFLNDRWMKL